ncbi:MAG: exodeoxyribonuclease V subunit gamma [Endozoicomonadaceae bacterium]|nr:exodeoxyribonuclease V subunit gamma [Endozoicomonadaceae bacterium]
MFTVYQSNRLDILKELLVELIRRQPLINPFIDEQILVQSPGMAQWLRLELASSLGIAAGMQFPLPASFIWQMFVQVLDGIPERSAFNKEAMTWKIITLLPEHLERSTFASLKHYLIDDTTGLRRYQLAERIADMFDQYLVYRPEWISAWEQQDSLVNITASQPWQPELWCALVEKTSELQQPIWHRANLYGEFIRTLQQSATTPNGLPERLFVFGVSALPPHYVEALEALGKHCDIHLMVTNPCQYFWGDIRDPKYLAKLNANRFNRNGMTPDNCDTFTNPLLASMGKLGRDYLHQLQALPSTEIDAFAEPPTDSLLHTLQKDILNLKERGESVTCTEPLLAIAPEDRSFAIHACHSPLREVEVLHDQLLALFTSDPDLPPRDIVVMMPDIDRYSPFVQAVFGSAPDERYIPWALSDRSASIEHPLLNSLMRLLTIHKRRCSAPDLMDILETSAVMRRFGFDTKGYQTVHRWVEEAGIRWGLNTHHITGLTLPDHHENTWWFGLQRMLLGYAMPEADGLYDNILPYDAIQGLDAALCGQLAAYIEAIRQLYEDIESPRTIEEWIQFSNRLLERFYTPDSDDERPLNLIRSSLDHLHQQLLDAGYHETLSCDIFSDYLATKLEGERGSQRFLTGQVNFCTLMPMRSIPFRVVCLLGMNDSVYPRTIPPTGFDLIARHPQRGDRSRRDDDRYLFLEAMLSAGDRFYISYVGHSITDNSERIPSVLVTELLNYCDQGFNLQGEPEIKLSQWLITEHPLQPFNPDYFRTTTSTEPQSLFSFAGEWLPAAKGEGEVTQPFIQSPLDSEPLPDTVELTELLRFYRNPCEYFCNRRLKVWFNEPGTVLDSDEPFSLNPLESYHLRDALLNDLLQTGNTDDSESRRRASGDLPHGYFGHLILEEQKESLVNLSETIRSALHDPADDLEMNLTLNGTTSLTGWLKQCTSTGLVRYRPGKLKPLYLLRYWIEHLCYCTCAPTPARTAICCTDRCCFLQAIPSETAQSHLNRLMAFYLEGLNQPQPLFPSTAMAWLDEVVVDSQISTEESVIQTAKAKAFNTYYGGESYGGKRTIGESDNRYIQRIYPELHDELFETIKSLSQDLLLPAHNALESILESTI